MTDSSQSSLFLGEAPAAVPMPRVAVRAYLALVAATGGAVTAVLLMMSVATNSGSEAERIADTRSGGYAATLIPALAVNLSRPLR